MDSLSYRDGGKWRRVRVEPSKALGLGSGLWLFGSKVWHMHILCFGVPECVHLDTALSC